MKTKSFDVNINRSHYGNVLRVIAVMAIVAVTQTTLAESKVQALKKRDITPSQKFGRMFHHLPAFAPATDTVIDALLDLGKKGGLMDANDDLSVGPILLITDPNESLINRNNPTHTAGVTFFGQFLDHDMTFDQTSQLGVQLRRENRRTRAQRSSIWIPSTPTARQAVRSYLIPRIPVSSALIRVDNSKTCRGS